MRLCGGFWRLMTSDVFLCFPLKVCQLFANARPDHVALWPTLHNPDAQKSPTISSFYGSMEILLSFLLMSLSGCVVSF